MEAEAPKAELDGDVLTVTMAGMSSGWEQWFLLISDAHWDNPHCDRRYWDGVHISNLNAKAKRKARREELPPTVVTAETVETYTTGIVERVPYLTNPCPKCGLTELRRIAGTDSLICYRCKQWTEGDNTTSMQPSSLSF